MGKATMMTLSTKSLGIAEMTFVCVCVWERAPVYVWECDRAFFKLDSIAKLWSIQECCNGNLRTIFYCICCWQMISWSNGDHLRFRPSFGFHDIICEKESLLERWARLWVGINFGTFPSARLFHSQRTFEYSHGLNINSSRLVSGALGVCPRSARLFLSRV